MISVPNMMGKSWSIHVPNHQAVVLLLDKSSHSQLQNLDYAGRKGEQIPPAAAVNCGSWAVHCGNVTSLQVVQYAKNRYATYGQDILLQILKLILNSRTVTTPVWIAPGNHRSISQDRGKCLICSLDLLHISQLILNCGTVTTTVRISPRNHWSIGQDRCKCITRGFHLLHIPQLILNCAAVAVSTRHEVSPGNYPVPSTAPHCKSCTCCRCSCMLCHSS